MCNIQRRKNWERGNSGLNSVVTHDIPEYTIVAGNPAKIVKKLSH